MSTIHPKYSTEMHQNTTFYAELDGEHAGEGFMPLRSIVLETWTREQRWKTDSFLVPLLRPGALFSVASYPCPGLSPKSPKRAAAAHPR